jgi:AAA+ superfamily predicted ATPase
MQRFGRRPTLPPEVLIPRVGTLLRSLWADATCELYEIAGDHEPAILVFSPSSQLEGLIEEWPTTFRESPARGFYAVGPLPEGQYLGEAGCLRAHPNLGMGIRQLAARAVNAEPLVFSPYTLWLRSDGTTFSPIGKRDCTSRDAVRALAGVFYWAVGGIDLDTCSKPPNLQSLVQTSVPELDVIQRCAMNDITPDELLETLIGFCPPPTRQAQSRQGLGAIAGMHELKRRLVVDVVDAFKSPDLYNQYGLTLPNGILLFGPPGCGKTYVAKRLGEELEVEFLEISPSSAGSPYIHETAQIISTTFAAARKKAPAILFIDEFEAFVPRRSDLGGHQQYKSEEVNEFLLQLNEAAEKRVLVVAATNEPDKIDPAVLRTGRMDKLIFVGPPDDEARCEMLTFHLHGRLQSDDIEIARLVEVTRGFSASDLKYVVDEAARDALSLRAPITTEVLELAATRMSSSISDLDLRRYDGFITR